MVFACALSVAAGTFAGDRYLLCQREARRAIVAALADANPARRSYATRVDERYRTYQEARDFLNAPKFRKGESARDFRLTTVLDRRQVHLADFRGRKPVVLVFGSFGCNLFCADLERLERIRRTHGGGAEFLFVYITEGPHAMMPPLQPPMMEDRLTHVLRGLRHFALKMCCVLDDSDATVENAYNSFPRRLIVIDRDGRIALDLGKGLDTPWNWGELERWLKARATRPSSNRPITPAAS